MSQLMHILRKDVRRLRWLLALWLVLLIVRVLLAVNGAAAANESVAAGLLLQKLWDTMWVIELILGALIVTQLVHEEPLVGFTPFWLTRPYVRTVLLREKLLFAAVVLIALPLIADLLMLSLFNAGPRALVRAGATAVLGDAAWMLSLMVLAVLTSSLAAFVLTALGLVAAAWTLLAVLFGFFRIWTEPTGYTLPVAPDATPVVVMTGTYLCAAFSVVVYQYHRRRWRVAAGLAVAGLAASVAMAAFWPWPFARGELVRAGAWASGVAVAHDPSWGTRVSDVVNVSRQMGERWRRLNARVTLSGIPPQMMVRTLGIRSTMQFPDGSTVESGQAGGYWTQFSQTAAEAALKARVLATGDFSERADWSPMITIRDQDLIPHRGQAGRLESDIDVHVWQLREIGTLPLTPGASIDRGISRLEIAGVQRGTDSHNVVIRHWRAEPPFSANSNNEQLFALRRRSGGEALMGGVDNSWQLGGGGGLIPVPVDSGGFSVGALYLRFPGPGYGIPKDLDIASFDDAELVVLEMAPAGVVTRRLTIDPFVVPAR